MDDRGKQFDILDKSLAARGYELLARPWIYRQDYDHWMTSYNQLEKYAEENSDNSYVASQWRDEKPRYANAPSWLLAKVRTANPANYNTAISISRRTSCGCNENCGTKIPQLPYSPLSIGPGNYGTSAGRGGTNLFFGGGPSVGDGLRNFFSPSNLPFFPNPQDDGKLVDKKEITNGIIVALVVGVILWLVHYLTKKKLNA